MVMRKKKSPEREKEGGRDWGGEEGGGKGGGVGVWEGRKGTGRLAKFIMGFHVESAFRISRG